MHTKSYIAFIMIILLTACASFSSQIQKGERLFNDPTLGNGTSGKTCNTCHENGEGISNDFDKKKQYTLMGLDLETLPEVINNCIEITLRGEEIDPQGDEMQALKNYIRHLKEKTKYEKALPKQ